MPVTEATCSLINVGLLSLKCPMSLKLSDFVASSDVLLDIMNWLLVELSICWQDLQYSIAHSVTTVPEVDTQFLIYAFSFKNCGSFEIV